MDFAALMKSQMASAPAETSTKRYLKRSEVESQRQAAYLQEQQDLEQARLDRLDKKRKRDDDEAERVAARDAKKARLAEESRKRQAEEDEQAEAAKRKRLGLPELVKVVEGEATGLKDGEDDVIDGEMCSKLRELDEPITLFGEQHPQRLRRYKRLLAISLAPALSTGPIPTSIALLPEADMRVPETVPADAAGHAYLLRQLASYFDMILAAWQRALAARPRDVQESFLGKQAYASFLAARENLVPLFRHLEASTLDPVILASVLEIVSLAQSKKYVSANDAYLRLSIGKAAWPIGVTMVGIHERSAREKLHSDEAGKAHILADEGTRKMLQGIKRCLSFAQTRWPPEDAGQLMG